MHEAGYEKLEFPTAACRRFDGELQAHLEGETRAAVVAHTRECPFCRAVLADLEEIHSVSAELAVEEPPARLWANLRAALREEGLIRESESLWQRLFSQFLPSPVAVAALACLMVLGGALLWRPEGWPSRQVVISPPPVDSASVALTETIGDMEKNYQARVPSFDPSVKATYEQSLRSLNGEIRECLESVRQEPDNALAREYLLTAYEQKAEVLQSALELSGP